MRDGCHERGHKKESASLRGVKLYDAVLSKTNLQIKFTFETLFRSKDIESKFSFRWGNLTRAAELTDPASACICDLSLRSSTLIFGFLYLIRRWRETAQFTGYFFFLDFRPFLSAAILRLS